ncbi:Galactosylgalactosylxylosylprotein 3-beta-glucuronosyltransferase S [Orchesella cincta]|uniref:Galactosylgalactosylxylosylprotein 3-beta-glucuronosyltransferase n=1 Tax=Orchesella cincta TaxID=48709 RepID=A0A1D2N2N6_ORCCI|nr:Galactosylgalactosylxylosylprotein 3-beta-glucuronosyltransferase S [Orchesella cincta]
MNLNLNHVISNRGKTREEQLAILCGSLGGNKDLKNDDDIDNIMKSSQLPNRNDLRSHHEELKHFEGVALPPDNANLSNDILSSKDLLLGDEGEGSSPGPTVWIVTPTFYRPEQKPELTRVAQALLPVSDFVHWIVIEDVSKGSETSFEDLKKFLQRFPLAVTVLKSLPPKSRIVGKPRGLGGRSAAIDWLRENAKDGVVYFCDDDNTYSSNIFKQMQSTEKVTMWPVGLVTDLGVSSPIVKNGRVVGFYDGWNGQRKFPVDMAGFAINLQMFLDNPKASMPWKAGYEEDELLQSLGVTMKDIKPLANNCTEILVWHTKAVKNVWPKRPKNLSPSVALNTNLHVLLKQLPQKTPVSPVDSHNKSENGFSFLRMFFGSSL